MSSKATRRIFLRCWFAVIPVMLIPALVMCCVPLDWPAWACMGSLAIAIFAACKLLTLASCECRNASVRRQLAYLLAWPGMNADEFLQRKSATAPLRSEWILAVSEMLAGAAVLWSLVPVLPEDALLLRGWVGMIGVVLCLHFGFFLLLSCMWRQIGVNAKPLMDWPIASSSLSAFWGRRWNRAFRDLAHGLVFRPLTKRVGPRPAMLAGFLFSGIVHDLVISVPARGGYGLPTLYFLFQGAALLLERSVFASKLDLGHAIPGWFFAMAVVIGPVFLLFHRPFVERVILPFLSALGAD